MFLRKNIKRHNYFCFLWNKSTFCSWTNQYILKEISRINMSCWCFIRFQLCAFLIIVFSNLTIPSPALSGVRPFFWENQNSFRTSIQMHSWIVRCEREEFMHSSKLEICEENVMSFSNSSIMFSLEIFKLFGGQPIC